MSFDEPILTFYIAISIIWYTSQDDFQMRDFFLHNMENFVQSRFGPTMQLVVYIGYIK